MSSDKPRGPEPIYAPRSRFTLYLTDAQRSALELWAGDERRSVNSLLSIVIDEAIARDALTPPKGPGPSL